jgi:hypothetical protein
MKSFRDPGADLAGFYEDKFEWSRETFGLYLPLDGVVAHIEKELKEVLEDPSDLEEWVDVIFLAMDGAARAGHSGKALVMGMVNKFQVLRKRKWTKQKEGHFEHEREGTVGTTGMRTYKLMVGCAQFGPFTTWRAAADLAVKMQVAIWSTERPGELAWFRPLQDNIVPEEDPMKEAEEQVKLMEKDRKQGMEWSPQVKKALLGDMGNHPDRQFEISVELAREKNCAHTFPDAELRFTVSTDGRCFPWIRATCPKCGKTREATL